VTDRRPGFLSQADALAGWAALGSLNDGLLPEIDGLKELAATYRSRLLLQIRCRDDGELVGAVLSTEDGALMLTNNQPPDLARRARAFPDDPMMSSAWTPNPTLLGRRAATPALYCSRCRAVRPALPDIEVSVTQARAGGPRVVKA
jgi:hypothetical protein